MTEQLEVVPLRHPLRWISAVLLVVVAGFIVKIFVTGQIAWSVVGDFLTVHVIVYGAWRTILISVLSMLIGLVLGVIFALMRLSKNPVAAAVAWFYVWFFRGTPVLLQLLMWFNLALVLPTIDIFGLYHAKTVQVMTATLAALLGLGINQGAYLAEIIRAGIISVGEGQTEAAQALGMTRMLTMRRVILPQAARMIIPPIGNDFISLLKTSSLASAIAYPELLYHAQQIYFTNNRVMELLIVSAIWYLAIVSVFSIGQFFLERRFSGARHRSGMLDRLVGNMRARRASREPSHV